MASKRYLVKGRLVRIGKSSIVINTIVHFMLDLYYWWKSERLSPITYSKKKFKESFGRALNLNDPKTLNEKIQWLKIYDYVDKPFYTQCSDKYWVRSYIAKEFGEEYLVPLLFETTDCSKIQYDSFPDCHCIVKPNHSSGDYIIVRDKNEIDFQWLRNECNHWLKTDYYRRSKEWQYKNIERRIIVEKLLEKKDGKIPNDYKLHFINGEFQFVYVSYDREGVNDRCVFDENWNRLPFVWLEKVKYKPTLNTALVPRPASFKKMIEFGTRVAQNFKYVRVDFFDVDGQLFFGEITLCHGGGFDSFFPEEYDLFFGNKLSLK